MKKTSVQSNINLETLAGGAFAEKLNEALMQVAENIQNPNTEATTKRQIQITLKFAPNKTRQLVSTQIAVTTKLAASVKAQERPKEVIPWRVAKHYKRSWRLRAH